MMPSRIGSFPFSLGLLGFLVSCGNGSYRLGGAPVGASGSGGVAQGGAGARESGGSGGLATGGASGSAGLGSVGGVGGVGAVGVAGETPLTRDIVRIATGSLAFPNSIDADEQYVYFGLAEDGGIWRIDHFGLGLQMLAAGRCECVVTDETHVYWITQLDIRRVAKTGGQVEVVAIVPPGPELESAGLWLALDDAYVYMSTYNYQPDGMVLRAPKTGGEAQMVARSAGVGVTGLAVNQNALYWADEASGGDIHRTDLETGETAVFHQAQAVTLRVIGEDLWFSSVIENGSLSYGPLGRVPLGGGPTTYSIRRSWLAFEGDDAHVYWVNSDYDINYGGQGLRRINRATGAEELVASFPIVANGGIAVTREWLFLDNSFQAEPGGIFRIKKPPP